MTGGTDLSERQKQKLTIISQKFDDLCKIVQNQSDVNLTVVKNSFFDIGSNSINSTMISRIKNHKLKKEYQANDVISRILYWCNVKVIETRFKSEYQNQSFQALYISTAVVNLLTAIQAFENSASCDTDDGDESRRASTSNVPELTRRSIQNTNSLARMSIDWGGHNMTNEGQRTFFIQLEFGAETDEQDGKEYSFALKRCQVDVTCGVATVGFKSDLAFELAPFSDDATPVTVTPGPGGYGIANFAIWVVTSADELIPMKGKYEAYPFGDVSGAYDHRDKATLTFILRDIGLTGAKLPPDGEGARAAEQWLRKSQVPESPAGRFTATEEGFENGL